jgi:hypothetical protein
LDNAHSLTAPLDEQVLQERLSSILKLAESRVEEIENRNAQSEEEEDKIEK